MGEKVERSLLRQYMGLRLADLNPVLADLPRKTIRLRLRKLADLLCYVLAALFMACKGTLDGRANMS